MRSPDQLITSHATPYDDSVLPICSQPSICERVAALDRITSAVWPSSRSAAANTAPSAVAPTTAWPLPSANLCRMQQVVSAPVWSAPLRRTGTHIGPNEAIPIFQIDNNESMCTSTPRLCTYCLRN